MGGPPSAQSSFAGHERYSRQGDVLHHLEGRYPFFLAPTSSCAKPVPSSGIRVSTLISRGPCRLQRAFACFFPYIIGLPQIPPVGRLTRIARKETSCGGCFEIVAIPYVQAS